MVCLFSAVSNRHDRKKDCRGNRDTTSLLRNFCSLLSTVLPISRTVWPKLEELIPEKNSLEKIPKPLKRWMGRPQLLPEIVENVLRSLFWAAGSKQPSPCLQPPKVGGLLRHLLLLLKAPLTSLHFWSQIYMDFSQLWFRFLSSLAPSPTLHPAPSPPSSSPWWPCQPPSSPPGRPAHTHTRTHTNTHTHTIIFSSIEKCSLKI